MSTAQKSAAGVDHPMPRQRTHPSAPMAQLPDGGLVNRVAMAIVRHHADDPADRMDVVEMMRTGTSMVQLEILLRHMGSRKPLLMSSFSTTTTNGRLPGRNGGRLRNVDCSMSLRSGQVVYGGGRLTLTHLTLPDTVMTGLVGRPVSSVIEHPYLPDDLIIGSVRRKDTRGVLVEFVKDIEDQTP